MVSIFCINILVICREFEEHQIVHVCVISYLKLNYLKEYLTYYICHINLFHKHNIKNCLIFSDIFKRQEIIETINKIVKPCYLFFCKRILAEKTYLLYLY